MNKTIREKKRQDSTRECWTKGWILKKDKEIGK